MQPVIPFSLSADWNLISRTIVPLIYQTDLFPGTGSQSGIGDVLQSVFFSPAAPTAGGWIWGVGPALLLPTGNDDLLTADQWAAGPTAVALRQQGPWTVGALTNHLWSFAGDGNRDDINSTFLQPFLSYTTPTAWTYTLQSESFYDWDQRQWLVPIRAVASKVTRLGGQLVSLAGGVHYWAEGPAGGPEGWGRASRSPCCFRGEASVRSRNVGCCRGLYLQPAEDTRADPSGAGPVVPLLAT